jgi:hypothetical protein
MTNNKELNDKDQENLRRNTELCTKKTIMHDSLVVPRDSEEVIRIRDKANIKVTENTPIDDGQNIPLDLLGQYGNNCKSDWVHSRGYIKKKHLEALAISRYKQNGRGISFNDLLSNGLAQHKEQAQAKLKYCMRAEILFAPYNHKPQQYYPTCFKSEILNKIIPVRATGVRFSKRLPFRDSNNNNGRSPGIVHHDDGLDSQIDEMLEGYVLPLLPDAPLQIHKMHLKTRITSECYQEIVLPANPWNRGKEHEEIIGRTRARYRFYANGTIVVSTESSNSPFRLVTESDCGILMAFLGQLRDRLVLFLVDKHERLVPDIMQWYLTQFDINKDVKVSDWLQFTGIKIQVRHALHLFRIYIKSKGKDTVCRVEESINPKNRSAVEMINDIFNPHERLEKQIGDLSKKIDHLALLHHNCVNCSTDLESTNYDNTTNVNEGRGSINC